jgi:hypothetical protein
MFYDERDFRAIIFSSEKFKSLESVENALAETPPLGKSAPMRLSAQHPQIEAFRVTYFSKKCFIRTFDPAKRDIYSKMEKEGPAFDYEIFVMLDRRSKSPLILVAAPFSGLALEIFAKIHQGRDKTFAYHRPLLEGLIEKVASPAGVIKHLRTLAINWLIAGDSGRCDQITLRGADVAHSAVFSWTNAAMKSRSLDSAHNGGKHEYPVTDLKLTLRKVEVCYDDQGGREQLRFSFDRFGNYSIWVDDEGKNLPVIFEVIDRLQKRNLLASDSTFPVRNRFDEPRLL